MKRLNGSSEVEIGRSISNAVEVSEWTVKLFSGINVKTQVNPVIDCVICLVLSPAGYHNNFMRYLSTS